MLNDVLELYAENNSVYHMGMSSEKWLGKRLFKAEREHYIECLKAIASTNHVEQLSWTRIST